MSARKKKPKAAAAPPEPCAFAAGDSVTWNGRTWRIVRVEWTDTHHESGSWVCGIETDEGENSHRWVSSEDLVTAPKLVTKPKGRRAPAFDASVVVLQDIATRAKAQHWSPKTLRKWIRESRTVSRGPYRRAVKAVFGGSIFELPDLRQLDLFGSAS